MAIARGDRAQAYCFSNHFLWPLVSRCCSRRRLSALASSNAPQPHTIFAVAIFANAPSAYDSIGVNVCTFRLLHVDAARPLPTQELQCGGAGRSMHRQFRACRALSAARARVPWDDALAPFGSRLLLRWLGATPTPYTYTLVILRLRIRQRRIHRQVLVAEEARHIAGELSPLLARHEILREQPAALLRRQSPKITRSPV